MSGSRRFSLIKEAIVVAIVAWVVVAILIAIGGIVGEIIGWLNIGIFGIAILAILVGCLFAIVVGIVAIICEVIDGWIARVIVGAILGGIVGAIFFRDVTGCMLVAALAAIPSATCRAEHWRAKEHRKHTKPTISSLPKPIPSSEFTPPPTTPTTPTTTLRTVWDPSNKDFVWDAEKPDEYGELPRIKRWIEGNNPNIYWFLLKIVNHADHPVTEWNVTLHTEQALTITEAHLDEKRVRIVKSDFDTGTNRNVCVVAIPPELGVSIPANGGRRSMYFKMDIRCEDALKMEFGVSGVAKLGKSPQIEVPIKEKRFTYACKYGDFRNMYYGSIDSLASMAITNLQDSYSREIVQNFTDSFRLIREFENYCKDRYAESEILIGKLEVVHSSLKAAEPITKDEILPLVEENLAALRMMSGVEAQKERGIRMCEQLIELLHIATSKIK